MSRQQPKQLKDVIGESEYLRDSRFIINGFIKLLEGSLISYIQLGGTEDVPREKLQAMLRDVKSWSASLYSTP